MQPPAYEYIRNTDNTEHADYHRQCLCPERTNCEPFGSITSPTGSIFSTCVNPSINPQNWMVIKIEEAEGLNLSAEQGIEALHAQTGNATPAYTEGCLYCFLSAC